MIAGNVDDPHPPLYKQSSGPLMDETGRAAIFMAGESPILICPYRRQQMIEEKDINYNPVTVLLQVGSAVCNMDIPELGVR